MKLDDLATLISGHALGDGGLDLTFSSDKWPPVLILPPDGIELGKLEEFVATILGKGLGYAGIDGSLKDFFNLMPTIQGVYLTRFEVDLNDSGRNAFFVGFQLRESWNIISDSGLPNIPALVISDPGFTIGSLGCDSSYMVDVYGTLEIFGAAVQVIVQWPAMIITGTLVREFDLRKLLTEVSFTEQVNFGDEAGGLKIRAMMLKMDLNNKAFDFTFGMSGWQILPDDKLTLNNLLLDLSISSEHKSAGVRAQMTVCGTGVDLSGRFQDGQTVFSGSTSPGRKIQIGELINDLAGKFSAEQLELPTALKDLVIENLDVSFNTKNKDFKFTCEASSGNISSKFDINIKHQDGNYEMELGGSFEVTLQAQSLNFDLKYKREQDEKKRTQALVASYHHTGEQSLCISGLVTELAQDDQGIQAIIKPLDIEIDLKSVVFVYYKECSTQPNKTSKPTPALDSESGKFLFGVTLNIGASVDLKSLPLVGNELESIDVEDLQLLIASQPFEASHVEAVNGLLPEGVTKLPVKAESTESEKPKLEDSTSAVKKPSKLTEDKKEDDKTRPVLIKGINLSAVLKLGKDESGKDISTPLILSPSGSEQPAEAEKEKREQKKSTSEKSVVPVEATTPSVTWIKIQKSFGPVRFERVGFQFQSQEQAIWFLLDASLSASGLALSLDGLGFGSNITKFDPQFDLHGLGIYFKKDQLEIGGAFLRMSEYEYGGTAIFKTDTLTLSAIGLYKSGKDPSMFIYAFLDYPLGGPPFFYVTGLAAGFGYNRLLVMPPVDQVAQYPLVAAVCREKPADAKPADPGSELQTLCECVPVQTGQYLLAAGVKFTSFKMIDSFALLVVSFGEHLEIDILGRSTIKVPFSEDKQAHCIAEMEIAFKASFIPAEGFLGVMAQLTSSSYILSKDCHLTGGMAFYSWFSGDHAGDFVLTVGGYHSKFPVPAHYPQRQQVPPLAINWQVSSALSIKGDAYFALTPCALMAGGHLEATWHSGPIKAWFTAGADFLIAWKPFHYDASIYVNMGVSYTYWFFGTRHISVDVGANLHIWGPEFSGVAHIHLWIVSFSVSFGAGASQIPEKIGWDVFEASFLPKDKLSDSVKPKDILSVSVRNGLVSASSSSEATNGSPEEINLGVINPKDFSLVVDSFIPIATYQVNGKQELGTSFGIAPMDIRDLKTDLTVVITQDDKPCKDEQGKDKFKLTPITKNVPAGLWGTKFQPDLGSDPLVKNVICGFEITPASPSVIGNSKGIDPSKLQSVPEIQDLHIYWKKELRFSTDKSRAGKEQDPARRRAMQESLGKTNQRRQKMFENLGLKDVKINITQEVADVFMIAPQIEQ